MIFKKEYISKNISKDKLIEKAAIILCFIACYGFFFKIVFF